ncbi:hypothetical protein EVAR_7419_1 [Eumeta japonica]|uniref:Uncharacterized protein n=1 Tax=Eumeta variegata TaxID=151549 RepID=A0A4C1V7S2_EUMVA|nr:hypothetical protein EVAR_7419_1 [Eumeta japonica]
MVTAPSVSAKEDGRNVAARSERIPMKLDSKQLDQFRKRRVSAFNYVITNRSSWLDECVTMSKTKSEMMCDVKNHKASARTGTHAKVRQPPAGCGRSPSPPRH